MTKSVIHFSHGNGYPAESYTKLFSFLRETYQVGFIPTHGHHPDYPVTQNWPHLVDELIHYCEKNYAVPVILLGHSFGGVISYLASIKKPELFRACVILDSPILGPWRSAMVKLSKKIGLINKITPASRTLNRRRIWKSKQAAFDYLSNKHPYKRFDEDCLWDYVNFGTEESDGGVSLVFDREIEYEIYRTLPHNLPKLKQALTIPSFLLYGKHSSVILKSDIKRCEQQLNIPTEQLPGGHLFPFEYPKQTAMVILNLLKEVNL